MEENIEEIKYRSRPRIERGRKEMVKVVMGLEDREGREERGKKEGSQE